MEIVTFIALVTLWVMLEDLPILLMFPAMFLLIVLAYLLQR